MKIFVMNDKGRMMFMNTVDQSMKFMQHNSEIVTDQKEWISMSDKPEKFYASEMLCDSNAQL